MDDGRAQRIREAIEPTVSGLGLRCYDVELAGGGRGALLRVLLERADGTGADLDLVAEATRALGPVLDELDPVGGSYTLEVSSPGLERPLRSPEHFAAALDERVTIKTYAPVDGARRHRGVLRRADDEGCTVEVDGDERRIAYADVSSARTVFDWEPASKPARGREEAARS